MTVVPGTEFRLRIEAEAGDKTNQYLIFIRLSTHLFFIIFYSKILQMVSEQADDAVCSPTQNVYP